jgi:hypothetical protein
MHSHRKISEDSSAALSELHLPLRVVFCGAKDTEGEPVQRRLIFVQRVYTGYAKLG